MNWILYGTEGCHLCEQALLLCQQQSLPIKQKDIIEDERLLALYRTQIPVLEHTASQRCLNWPFTESDLIRFLRIVGVN